MASGEALRTVNSSFATAALAGVAAEAMTEPSAFTVRILLGQTCILS